MLVYYLDVDESGKRAKAVALLDRLGKAPVETVLLVIPMCGAQRGPSDSGDAEDLVASVAGGSCGGEILDSGGSAALHPRLVTSFRSAAARRASRQVTFVVRNAVFAEQSTIFIQQRFRAVMFGLGLDVFDERVLSGNRTALLAA